MKILAIRFARLGDVVLLLPALASLKQKFPDSELTLLTGHRCASLAELCPDVDHVIAVDRLAMRDGPIWRALRDMARLARQIRQTRFDVVVDFHSFRETNLLTWFSGAPLRIGMKRDGAPYLGFCFNCEPVIEDKGLHVAEMFQKVVDRVPRTAGAVREAQARQRAAQTDNRRYTGSPLGKLTAQKAPTPTVVLFVAAPVPERIWPPERFAEIADFTVENLQAAVIAISSNDRPDLAAKVQASSRNPKNVSILTDLTLPQLAATIASAQLLVSNDTGPMHIGPAVGVPTLGLFSVGYPEHFRPIGPSDKFLRANPIEEIQVQEVTKAMAEMWATVDRGLRR